MKKDDREELLERLIVPPGKKISIEKDYDPSYRFKGLDKEEAEGLLQEGIERLAELQDKLYAQDKYALLVVLQALDAAGKDGVIKHVMSGLNPQGCQVYSFKVPSAEELDHDYLWRYFRALPERGRIGIFNRSYYEEVLVVRVHPEILDRQKLPAHLKGDGIWKRRFREIAGFEEYLAHNGIVVLKFFLYISKEEQKRRFLERIDRAEKNWKFSAADVKERDFWDDYIHAYEDCLNHTSAEWAPWYVIPADHKPSARLAVALAIHEALRRLDLRYPEASEEHRQQLLEARNRLENE